MISLTAQAVGGQRGDQRGKRNGKEKFARHIPFLQLMKKSAQRTRLHRLSEWESVTESKCDASLNGPRGENAAEN